jgi:Antitoxin ParD
MSRLTIDITDKQHQALKAMAALEGKTIKDYALERLFPAAQTEEHALAELKVLLEQRLGEAQRGEVTSKSITDIANEVISSDAK